MTRNSDRPSRRKARPCVFPAARPPLTANTPHLPNSAHQTALCRQRPRLSRWQTSSLHDLARIRLLSPPDTDETIGRSLSRLAYPWLLLPSLSGMASGEADVPARPGQTIHNVSLTRPP